MNQVLCKTNYLLLIEPVDQCPGHVPAAVAAVHLQKSHSRGHLYYVWCMICAHQLDMQASCICLEPQAAAMSVQILYATVHLTGCFKEQALLDSNMSACQCDAVCSNVRVCLPDICVKQMTVKMFAVGLACAETLCNGASKLTMSQAAGKAKSVNPVLLLNDFVFYVCWEINSGFSSHKTAGRLPSKKSNKEKQHSPTCFRSARM